MEEVHPLQFRHGERDDFTRLRVELTHVVRRHPDYLSLISLVERDSCGSRGREFHELPCAHFVGDDARVNKVQKLLNFFLLILCKKKHHHHL